MGLYTKKNLLDRHDAIKRRALKIASGAKGLRVRLRDPITGAYMKETGRYDKKSRDIDQELKDRKKIIDSLSPVKTYPAPMQTLNSRIKTNVSTWQNSLDSRNDHERALLLFLRFKMTGNFEYVADISLCSNNITAWLEIVFAGEEWIVNSSAIHKEESLYEPVLRKREAIQYVPAYGDNLIRKFKSGDAFYGAFSNLFNEPGNIDTYIIMAQEDTSMYHALPIAYSTNNR